MPRTITLLLVLVAAGLFMVGCSKKKPPRPTTVSGHVVRKDGTPVKNAKLEFVQFPFSEMSDDQVCPIALTQSDGSFKLRGNVDHEIVPRRYKVTVRGVLLQYSNVTPKIYHDPQTTPIDVIVPEGGLADLVIRIE